MILSSIETIVLANIGYDRYADLSVNTDTEKMADFALLHKCVHMAREEIKFGCAIPGLLKHATSITPSTTQARNTIAETDFDIPTVVRYTPPSGDTYYLERANPENLLTKVSSLTGNGDPSFYVPFGATAAGLSYIEIYPIPSTAGALDIDYKPVLTELTTSTDEDILMKKYFMTIIKIATAFAFQIIKKDNANFGAWITIGRTDFKDINIREAAFNASNTLKTDGLLATKRNQRYTV